MQSIFKNIAKIASGTANVHIYGKTGTGKQVAAALLHQLCSRNAYPLITIDCAGQQKINMWPGRFENEESLDARAENFIRGFLIQTGGGTLILVDINQMGLDLQEKLLRAIIEPACEESGDRTTVPRVVTTSNLDPQKYLRNGTMKPELFDHLAPVLIHLKPLRDCRKDLPALVNHFLNYYSTSTKKQVLPESIMRRLLDYDWPGNLYELQNTIQRYLAYDEIIFLPANTGSDIENNSDNDDNHLAITQHRQRDL